MEVEVADQKLEPSQKSSYGKRPIWQWIVLYVIIGAVVYALLYFLFFADGRY